jgi:hypothetical protein
MIPRAFRTTLNRWGPVAFVLLAGPLAAQSPSRASTTASSAGPPLRLELDPNALDAALPPHDFRSDSEAKAAANDEPPSTPGRIRLYPSTARSEMPRSTNSSRAAAAKPEPTLNCAVRTSLPWIAAVGALLLAPKVGARYVDADSAWFYKKREAPGGTDSWRNHASPTSPGAIERSTLHP